MEMVEKILIWAVDNESFDTTFVESIQDQLKDDREASEKQIRALENIIEKFGIE